MFGKPQRGVSERPNKTTQPRVPKWLWTLLSILVLIFTVVMLMLWRPWQPVSQPELNNTPPLTTEQNSNPDFRFYDLLPKQQVTPIPEQAVPVSTNTQPNIIIATPDSSASEAQSGSETIINSSTQRTGYILQVRSYSDADNADTRRAEIIMNGLAADVVKTEENGKTWYRVISGPYESQQAAMLAQQTLQNSGIDSIVVKLPY